MDTARGTAQRKSQQGLTDREREILVLFANGYTSFQAATRLKISPKTAEAHRNNIKKKLNLNNIAELVQYAVVAGIIKAKYPVER